MKVNEVRTSRIARAALGLAAAALLAGGAPCGAAAAPKGATVQVSLSEWKVELSPARVPPGPVTFVVANRGTIPHAFEVEGRGIERQTAQIPPGGSATLALTLRAGSFEAYCPIGNDSHRMLGMLNHLQVGTGRAHTGEPMSMDEMKEEHEGMPSAGPKAMRVTGGGPVIQILPGPFPFADSARAIIESRPADQRADLEKKAEKGPYSNDVATIAGTISVLAIDHGASGDSVSGTAEFTTKDGARWKLVMDRVQTRDIPYNPRFGGVIMGLYYHGASGVHTPLVPTIQSSLALWAFAHLWRDGVKVTDDAMVHIMLLSRTRRPGDFALACWDCSHNPVDELQLQVTPPPGGAPFDAPGGCLFVNWEHSSGSAMALR